MSFETSCPNRIVFFGIATRANPAAVARERRKVFMPPVLRFGAAHPGKSLMQVAAFQAFLDDFVLPSLGVTA